MKTCKSGHLLASALIMASASVTYSSSANSAVTDALSEMISNGKAGVTLRYRYETVEQDNALKDADASTLLSRLTLTSGTVNGFTVLLEADNVMTIGTDDYNSTMIGEQQFGKYSIVADPVGTEINQAWIKYAFSSSTSSTLGRQRILHAGQRFVGGVGWRQNEQTYDAFTVNYADSTYTLDYSYLWRVNRIFDGSGTSVQDQEFDSDSHILLATAKALGGKFSGFVYALDFKEPYVNGGSAGLPSITYGIGYTGAYKNFSYDLTYARQSDYGDNPVSYDANYVGIDTRLAVKPVTFTLGYELLGSDDGVKGFVTPLATLHKFQGWADIFLATPGDGIEDIYAGIGGSIGKVALGAFYHDFSSDEGSTDYGSEVDLVATYPINDNLNIQLKYADYSADDFAVDTEKLWFTVNLKF
ncbi:MAG: hypothetical protein CMK32_14560 [Porticoccaceae bacterium]|nr:hypothetical protein [Porticoccaceae bacterium]